MDAEKTAPCELVCSVPEAGAEVGLGRDASYRAARRGDIPTIKFGRLLKVPRAKWRRIVRGEEPA